jgi:hypothetical protein
MKNVGGIVASLVLVSACSKAAPSGGASPGSATPPSKGLGASLSVTAAALADDCGQGAAQAPAKVAAPAPAADSAPVASATMVSPGASAAQAIGCPPGVECNFQPPCQQSSVQLQLAAVGAGAPAPVVVTDIELLDQAGASLGHMTPRAPQVWTDHAYGAWDATLRPGESLKLSVPSSAPPWDKVPGGRFGGGMFQVRVSVTVGGTPYTATSTTSVAPEPMVAT